MQIVSGRCDILKRRNRFAQLFERHPTDLSTKSIERGHSVFKGILHEPFSKTFVGGRSERQQLPYDLDVLVQDLQRVVDSAIGAKREQPVDGVLERTAVTDEFCFEPWFDVSTDRRCCARHLRLNPIPNGPFGLMSNSCFFSIRSISPDT